MKSPQRPDLLSTKALTLRRLAPLIYTASVDAGHIVSRWNWRDRAPVIMALLDVAYRGKPLIVRSSARNEDSWHASAAGRYDSIVVKEHAPIEHIRAAIDKVFGSYGDDSDENHVFVQRYIDGISTASVVTSRVAATGAPYYVLAIDDTSHASDAVTAGRGFAALTWHLSRGGLDLEMPCTVKRLMRTVKEVESVAGSDQLDIELVVDDQQVTHLLQVRPLVLADPRTPSADRAVSRAIESCTRKLAGAGGSVPQFLGLSPFFSNMSDWNPAEMIGQRPRPLAMSLYRSIITDRIWAEQRFQYGYRDLRGMPLLHDFAGQPYIDVRASLLSFLPNGLPEPTVRRVVGLQLRRLAAEPDLHDRLEFNVAVTAVSLDIETRMRQLMEGGLTADECAQLRSALTTITSSAIGRLDRDTAMINLARSKRMQICADFRDPLRRAGELLKAARPAIALPFAHLARAAFVSTAFIRSAVTADLATAESVAEYMRSLGTISAQLRADGAAVAADQLSWDDYVARYGDLRPGTYDPTVPRYRDAPEVYLRPFVSSPSTPAGPSQRAAPWFTAAAGVVSARLAQLGLDCDAATLAGFTRAAMAAREAGKFELSCWISAVLEGLVEAGTELGQTADDVSYWRLSDARQLARLQVDPDRLQRRVARRRLQHAVTHRLHLPATMSSLTDLRCFASHLGKPTYVGTGKSIGRVCLQPAPADLPEKGIVVLPSADPGFEWLFSRPLAGIITMYGGANSHLAVRCAESGIPAAIGVGQHIYAKLADAALVQLDCAGQTIEIIR